MSWTGGGSKLQDDVLISTHLHAQVRMENDEKEEWGEVMFVPAGALTQPEAHAELDPNGKGWRKRK